MTSIALCICTMNRPSDLSKCLKSVFDGEVQPDEVLVSDDSDDGSDNEAIAARYPVTYVAGPRQGLALNRVQCVAATSSRHSHILFIDDDVTLPAEYLRHARSRLAAL